MEYLTFEELQARIQELYHEGEYAAALDLATLEVDRFPEQSHLLYYWRISLATRVGDYNQAIDLLKEVLESGFWYREALLRQSPSLKPLQGAVEFEELVALNHRLREVDESHTFPLLTLRPQGQCLGGAPPCPLLLALHANASTAQASVEFWRPAATAGWLVAVPQSTQAMWKGAYVWDDRETTESEIKKHFAALTEQYAVDRERIILAGHSMGGEMAIWLALTGAIDVRGFFAIGLSGPLTREPENWLPILQENQSVGLRGYVILGEEDDTIPHETVEETVDLLNRGGIPCELEVVPHAGREEAADYESSLLRALAYIIPE